jgi:hypothetical protein
MRALFPVAHEEGVLQQRTRVSIRQFVKTFAQATDLFLMFHDLFLLLNDMRDKFLMRQPVELQPQLMKAKILTEVAEALCG